MSDFIDAKKFAEEKMEYLDCDIYRILDGEYENKDLKNVMVKLTKFANDGNSMAQYWLGYFYANCYDDFKRPFLYNSMDYHIWLSR